MTTTYKATVFFIWKMKNITKTILQDFEVVIMDTYGPITNITTFALILIEQNNVLQQLCNHDLENISYIAVILF